MELRGVKKKVYIGIKIIYRERKRHMGSVGHRHRKESLGNADGRKLRARREEEAKAGVAPKEEGVAVATDGSVPLEDVRRERYCQKIVAGVEQLEAWQQAFCDEEGEERRKKATALMNRFRCGSRPEVIERIRWLNENGKGCVRITKAEKAGMLDSLLKKTYERAMDEHASAKDVGACLDVLARHDMVNGDVVSPKLEVVFPQMEQLFGALATAEIEKRLGIKKADGEVVEKEPLKLGGGKEHGGK